MPGPSLKHADQDPFAGALRNAPRGEPFTSEQAAELEHNMAQLAAGTLEVVPEYVKAKIDAAMESAATGPNRSPEVISRRIKARLRHNQSES